MSKETKFALAVILLSAVYVLVFHLFIFDTFYGWPVVLLFALLTISVIAFKAFHGKQQNIWAYIFIGPIILVSVAEVLYANDIMRLSGLVISFFSLSFLSFWLLSPRITWKQVKSFWSPSWFIDTFVPMTHKGPWSRLSIGKSGRQAFIGVLIAVPFTLIFVALFLSADPLIGKVISDVLKIDDPAEFILRLIFDAFLAFFFARVLWYAITRMLHERMPRWNEYKPSEASMFYIAFLSVLNLLFLVFISFQFVYFFGGQAIVEAYGLTYANYARQGFFQLFSVSVIIFGILYVIKWKTRMHSLSTRLLSVGLILQSWIVIASAMRRLSLYIDAYGLTVLRYWAFAGLIVAAAALLLMVVWIMARGSFSSFSKTLVIGTLYLFSGLFLINAESIIVEWNGDRKPTELVSPDYMYPFSLSPDAFPAYVSWLKRSPDDAALACDVFQFELGELMRETYWLEKDKFRTELFDQYRDATIGRVPLASKGQIFPELESGSRPYLYQSVVFNPATGQWDSASRTGSCQLGDWKAALRIFGPVIQADILSDARRWTWSDHKTLEALKSL
jgi:hypothetical protein